MIENEDSRPKDLGLGSTDLLDLAASASKRPTPTALAIPTAAKRPVAAVEERRVVVPVIKCIIECNDDNIIL